MFVGRLTMIPISNSVYPASLNFNVLGANIFSTLSEKSSGFFIALPSRTTSNVDNFFR